jgi:CelD/BcsL family acetyltransferase involved in cellulose biosynthesis
VEWRELFARVPIATPFHSFEWNRAVAAYEARDALRILAIRAAGELVGVAPFCLRPGPLPGLRTLDFVGAERSDYRGFLVDPAHREAFAHLLADWISGNREIQLVSLEGLRAPAVELLAGCSFLEERPVDVCPIARLPATLEAYERDVMHPKLRETVRRENRKLGDRARFALCREAGEIEEGLSVLFDLHQRRQRARGERGRFFDPRWQQAFRDLSRELCRGGFLRLGLLRIDGRPAAVSYNLRSPDREVYYIGGFEPAFARHSPGSLMQYHMIASAIEDGVGIYDFGRGDEHYKSWWCNDGSLQFRVEGARPHVLLHASRARRALRRSVTRSRLLKRVYLLVHPMTEIAEAAPLLGGPGAH